MKEWIRKALTKKRCVKKGKRRQVNLVQEPPSERLVMITEFSIAAIVALTAIEVVHVIVLRSWNAEVFSALSGLIGTVTGIIVGRKV